MKTVRKRVISIILMICILVGIVFTGFQPENTLATPGKNEAITGDATGGKTYKTNPAAARGSEENPFVVLEVVPTLDQAQFGYFIPGCEPVDMDKSAVNYAQTSGILDKMSGGFSFTEDWVYECYENIPVSTPYYVYAGDGSDAEAEESYSARTFEKGYWTADSIDQTTYNVWWQAKYDSNCQQKGYFEKVSNGTGNFELVETDDWNAYNCTHITVPGSYSTYYAFRYKEGGNYVWHQDDNEPEDFTVDENLSIVWTTRNDLFKCHSMQITNKDRFVQEVLEEDSSDFISKVITITPEQLAANLDLIDVADLIYFHTANNTMETMSLWNFASTHASATGELSHGELEGFSKHDLSNETVYRIMERMASSNPAALIFELTTMWENNYSLNTYKLTLMAMQYTPNDFVNTYGFLDKIKQESQGSNTLVYRGQTQWDIDTLTIGPDGSNLKSQMRYYSVITGQYNVLDHIFTYNGNNSLLQELFDGQNISLKSDPTNGGNTMEDMYEYYGTDETYEHTVVDALKFILNASGSVLSKIRVLEIQPCNEFIYGSEGWQDYYKGLFKGYNPSSDKESWVEDEDLLEVTTMPVWEFICSTGRYDYTAMDEETGDPVLLTTSSSDDLIAKYDLIIIGSNQTEYNGLNGYNDEDLGHLIYTAVGDTVSYNNYKTGGEYKYLETRKQIDLDEIRYTAIDISLKKCLELQDFLKAGRPIVVDDGLYASSEDKVDKKPDTTKVDSSSKLYQLLTWEDTSGHNGDANLLVYGMYSSGKMKSMLNKSQCNIVFYEDENRYPLEYSYTEGSNGVIVQEYYQQKDEAGKAILTYHFYVEGTSGENYQLYLHIDSDGDGVYRGSLKEHSEIDNMKAATGGEYADYEYDASERALSMKIYKVEAGKRTYVGTSSNYLLEPYQEYYATYELPEDRLGIVPWKLEINAASNEYQRSSAINYTAFAQTDEPDQVNVLQMCLPSQRNTFTSSSYGNGTSSATYFTTKIVDLGSSEVWNTYNNKHYFNPDYDYTSSNYSSTFANGGTTATKFQTYLAPVNEFNVNIQFLRTKEWDEIFGDNAIDENGKKLTKEQKIENWISFLSQYDMIILGFMDGNAFTGDEIFVEGFKDFAAQGKAIILSHDTVASSNFFFESYNDRWYCNFNAYSPWLRTFSGQRCSYYYYDNVNNVYVKSYTQQYTGGSPIYDMDSLEARIKAVSGERYVGQYYQFSKEIDSDVVDDSFYGTWTMEMVDNANQLLARKPTLYWSPSKIDRPTTNLSSAIQGWPDTYAMTTNIRLTNNGQITSYPYQIDEYITVLRTHTQNYRLDMEYQDGGDVNVWFSLTDTKNPNAKDKGSYTAVDMYSARDLDGQNSFYIYNKGNITYTGLGHVGGGTLTDDEVKLFVNTMISAYRAPDASPYATIDNADSVASDETSVLYIDGTEDTSEIMDTRVVTVNGQKMVRVEFSIQEGSGNTNFNGKNYYLSVEQADGITLDVYDAAGTTRLKADKGQYNVQTSADGASYILYVPYTQVVQNGSIDFSLTVYSTYIKGGRTVETSKKTTKGTVTLLPLFDLT